MKVRKISDLCDDEMKTLLHRFGDDFTSIMVNTVVPIVNDIRVRGDDAVREYVKKFDGAEIDSLMADASEIEKGYDACSSEVIESFEKARANIEEFHLKQKRDGYQYSRGNDGIFGVTYHPLSSAAVYVPGGKAAYPSSVLMGVIPAKIAGVEKITLVTPVKKDGKLNDAVCAVCKILGVDSVLKVGGAQGIAAVGFGTKSVPKADIIVGPGNPYVTAAKSYLFSLGVVAIDSLAGPSETLVITDTTTDPKWIAWDLLSQAEHSEDACAVLVDLSEDHARKVCEEIEKDIYSGRGRSAIKKASIDNHFSVLIASSIDEAIEFSNAYAPEHMQLVVDDPLPWVNKIRNVGSLFLGRYSPVAAGDYFSGTNHVLPTGGAARFSSGLSVETFYRRTTYQMLSKDGLEKAEKPINIMSALEGFDDKHGGSVRIRFGND